MESVTKTQPARARHARSTCAAMLAIVASVTAVAAQDSSLEYAVKATYLYKLGPFVHWPDRAFASPTSPFNICVVGRDPFGAQLDNVVRGEQLGSHPIAVHRLDVSSARSSCHVLYISGSMTAVVEAVKQAKGSPVLTVTEIDRAAGRPGIINFVIQGNRVRFEIDNQSASENDLVLSSKLLSLASSVTPKSADRSE